MFLDRFVNLLNVMVRIPRVGGVHTHQFDVLSLNHDRGSDGTFVDVFGVDDSLPPPFVQHKSDSVFVVVFSRSHENVFVMCLPYFSLFMSTRFTHSMLLLHQPVTKYLNVDLLLFFKCIILFLLAVQNCGAAASFVIVASFLSFIM